MQQKEHMKQLFLPVNIEEECENVQMRKCANVQMVKL